jgi:carbamoyl-phosphate synthase small subunit
MSNDRWNWKEKREKPAFLALEDGTIMRGHSVGAPIDGVGEVVFNTGLSGYQEIISDPSYAGQFVTMTYPEIGNTGINVEDKESRSLFLNGFIMHEMNETSNWRADESLRDHLIANDIPAIAGLDTHALTIKLRETGTHTGYLGVTG